MVRKNASLVYYKNKINKEYERIQIKRKRLSDAD